MKKLTLNQITNKIKKIKFGKFDLIVAIGKGGIIPASILSNHLNTDLDILWLNFRDKNNKPKYNQPKLIKKINLNYKNKRILLVDDVSKTGKTLEKAKKLLKTNKIKTFVLNGKADYSLFDFKECIKWPWDIK